MNHVQEMLRIEQWRTEELERLGYEPDQAQLIANVSIDLHELEALLDAGCPHWLAARILWPL
jgi:hypothetical protein